MNLGTVKQAGGNGKVGYEIQDGYATIAFGESGAQDAAKAAIAEAEQSPLSESKRFAETGHDRCGGSGFGGGAGAHASL